MLLWKYHTHRFVPAVTWIRLKGRITSNILGFNSTFDLTKTTHDKWEAQTGFQLVDKHEHWTSLCQLTQTVFSATWGSPLGVIVDEYVIFHSQFEVWDLLTHPPWAKQAHNHHEVIHLTQYLTVCGNVGADSERQKVTYRMVSMISWAASWCLSCECCGTKYLELLSISRWIQQPPKLGMQDIGRGGKNNDFMSISPLI